MPYSLKLPHKFLLWWLFKGPLRAIKIASALLSTANNELSFLTNIKLLFIPLFGLENISGRLISFFARLIMIVSGLIFMTGMLIVFLFVPILWYVIPIILYNVSKPLLPIFFLLLYVIWVLVNLNKPEKKISETFNQNDQLKTYRPITTYVLSLISSNKNLGMEKLLNNKSINYLLSKSELSTIEFKEKIIKSPKIDKEVLLKSSFEIAVENKSRYVEIEHLFFAILQNLPSVNTLLSTFNSDLDIIKQAVIWIVEEREQLSKIYIWQEDYLKPSFGGIGKGMLGRVTPKLDSVSTDLTKSVKKGKINRIVGREEEIKKIAEILDGEKNDILLIGEAGSGKTSILQGISYKIMYGTEYKTLKNKRIVSLDVGSLVAGSGSAENVAERLKGALEDAEASGDIILFIDEIQNLVTGMGERGGNASTIFSILENRVSSEKIRIIGATSISNYRKYMEPNEAISRLFQVIKIEEITTDDALKVLKYVARKSEKEHNVLITYPAIKRCVELSEKVIHERVLPDKAIDILDRATTRVKDSTRYLTSEEIAKEVSEMTDIPTTAINGNEAQKLLNIGDEMKKRVVGQNQAIDKIAVALQRARTGMRNEKKPIASFLFIGTTGIGKTETAKSLSSSYFGGEENMIRLDMSEYQQVDSINRILGSPDGSVTGVLTDSVRTKPYSLVLIDEIEKAHPNILLTFLQVLDEGILTDTLGNKADFTNTIIIATSNVGTKSIQSIFEKKGTYEEMQKSAMVDVRNKFAPELLNRFTSIVVFNPLSVENLRQITNLMLKNVKDIANEKGISLEFKTEVIDELIKRGYSPQWGARPLARVIEDTVESFLAVKILKNEVKSGDSLTLGMEVFGI